MARTQRETRTNAEQLLSRPAGWASGANLEFARKLPAQTEVKAPGLHYSRNRDRSFGEFGVGIPVAPADAAADPGLPSPWVHPLVRRQAEQNPANRLEDGLLDEVDALPRCRRIA
jgi:hypothetical protein